MFLFCMQPFPLYSNPMRDSSKTAECDVIFGWPIKTVEKLSLCKIDVRAGPESLVIIAAKL